MTNTARALSAYRKACELQEPEDGKRQSVDVVELTIPPPPAPPLNASVINEGLSDPEVASIDLRMAVMSGTVQRGTGPTWQQRARIAMVFALCLPAVIALAYVAARLIDWAFAGLGRWLA